MHCLAIFRRSISQRCSSSYRRATFCESVLTQFHLPVLNLSRFTGLRDGCTRCAPVFEPTLPAVCLILSPALCPDKRGYHQVSIRWGSHVITRVTDGYLRITNLPILLFIAFYERQAMDLSSVGFYETITSAAERAYDSLPRRVKRMSKFTDKMRLVTR